MGPRIATTPPDPKRMPKIQPVSDEVNEELKDYEGRKSGWVQVGPEKYLFPSGFGKSAQHFLNLKTRSDDVWICTFPRTGTTMTQELVWMIANGCPFETGKKVNLWTRSPFLESCTFLDDEAKKMLLEENKGTPNINALIDGMSKPGYEIVDEMPSPRIIKTHLPPSLLPFDIEETKAKDIPGHIKKIAQFLGYPITEEMTKTLTEHLDIKNFRNNPAVNFEVLRDVVLVPNEQPFIRKGTTGNERCTNEFTDEINAAIDRWVEENYKMTDLRFPSKQ